MEALSGAEALAVSVLCIFEAPVILAYLVDRLGGAIHPGPILIASLAATALSFAWLRGGASWDRPDLLAWSATVIATFTWIMRLARPAFLPTGHGADLTHHLMLVGYIEQHWRLVHDPSVEQYLGEFAQYTPGSHLLAALAGAWIRTDGFHAAYPLIAISVALKAGFVFLIAARLLRGTQARIPAALAAAILLFLPRAYLVGSFSHDFFFAQVVAELFAVALWWAIVVWEETNWDGALGLGALAGVATFLTWPVWIGPPLVAFALTTPAAPLSAARRVRALATLCGPIAAIAIIYAAGRLGWLSMAGTTGGVATPTPAAMSLWFLLVSAAGVAVAAMRRRTRATVLLLGAIAIQAAALFVAARVAHADTPYLALKMMYLAIYPLAVCGGIAIAAAARSRYGRPIAWALSSALALLVLRQLSTARYDRPVVSEDAYRAGVWARAHVPAGCVEYLVPDTDTAYWLHLAVLGNPRMSRRTADADTFDETQALLRWIAPGGLPYAIADLTTLPKDVHADAGVLAQFDSAAVLERRGAAPCR